MHNIVHIDEKWFYMTKKNRNYYLLDEEEEPTRTIQSGASIGNVMFLTAVARPKWDSEGNVTFSGKIGIWPFVKEIPAQRKSDNRPRGTMETKSIKVNRQVMREFMIENLLPAIQSSWPDNDAGQTIFIKQDNAKPHILPNDPEFLVAVESTGLDIRLIQQPANSPDLNGLDLGFFNSLQSLTDCLSPRTLQDLIKGVLEEFENYEVYKLNRVFLSLQACMIEILNHAGGNGYKIPHVNKERLESLGLLPQRLTCPQEVYANALHNLQLMERC
uniref:Transposase n=1 Tax=Hordeum vulgare subsp. vulgare TaxID=112509 RepID=A0A8I6WKB7_HORVV